MRDFLGAHVSQTDEFGNPADVDGVHVSIRVAGSFQVTYAENVDRICLSVARWTDHSEMRMQLTLQQATLLRELLAAGIADALAAAATEPPALPDADTGTEVSA